MKVYKVKVNGKVYEVEVESVTESNATITTPSKAPVTEEKSTPVVSNGAGDRKSVV